MFFYHLKWIACRWITHSTWLLTRFMDFGRDVNNFQINSEKKFRFDIIIYWLPSWQLTNLFKLPREGRLWSLWLFLETIWSLSGAFSFVRLTKKRNGRLDECYFNFHFTWLAWNVHVTFLRSVRIHWRHFAGIPLLIVTLLFPRN